MQVWVNPSELTGAADERVYMHWWAPNGTIVLPSAGPGQPGAPPGCVVLTVPDRYAETTGALDRPRLLPGWRGDMDSVINAECSRRILISFPEYMQRNASLQVLQNNIRYGMDSATWPQEARDQLNESKRGWDWITVMREASDALQGVNPVNPTDDSHWPAQLEPPVYVATG